MNAKPMVAELWAQASPASRELLCRAARAAGALGQRVFLVGGSIRDLLLGGDPADLDLVTEGDAQALAKAIARDLEGKAQSPSQFLTAVVELPDGRRLDVATARQETYPEPTKLPAVAPADLAADLWRRDFSINAIALELLGDGPGKVVDPAGGRADLAAQTIRVLHDRSFVDDPTRALRAVRFAVRLGFVLAAETQRLLAEAAEAGLLGQVSGARVRHEIVKVLAEPSPADVLERLADLGLLDDALPGCHVNSQVRRWLAGAPPALAALRGSGARGADWPYLLGVLAAQADATQVARRLDLSAQVRAVLCAAAEGASVRLPRALACRGTGSAVALDRALSESELAHRVVFWLRSAGMGRRRLEGHAAPRRRGPAEVLDGHDLQAAGVQPGPGTRIALEAAREARLQGCADKDAQLQAAVSALEEWRRPSRRARRRG